MSTTPVHVSIDLPAVFERTTEEGKREVRGENTRKTIENPLVSLQHDILTLREKLKHFYMEKGIDLYSKIAVNMEQAICSYVLPEIFKNDSSASLHDLLNHLNSENEPFPLNPTEYDREKILHKARERWEIICKDFNFPKEWQTKAGDWDIYDRTVPDDIRPIEILKLSGFGAICSTPISLKYAEQNVESIEDEMAPWQFKLVTGFIGSLRDKMTKSGLCHDSLLLD